MTITGYLPESSAQSKPQRKGAFSHCATHLPVCLLVGRCEVLELLRLSPSERHHVLREVRKLSHVDTEALVAGAFLDLSTATPRSGSDAFRNLDVDHLSVLGLPKALVALEYVLTKEGASCGQVSFLVLLQTTRGGLSRALWTS